MIFPYEAFWQLTTDRQLSQFGIGPITFSSIDRYATRYGIETIDSFRRFSLLIRALDDEYLRFERSGRPEPG